MIEIKNLNKVYKFGNEKNIVLNNMNLMIAEGEFISIVGPSGSGKTKLLHLIAGLDSPTSGEVLFFGKNLSTLKDKEKSKYRRESIGFVFQDFILEGEKSILENVMLPMLFTKIRHKEQKERALESLKMVHMEEKVKNKVKTLSGGQSQKVAIARALVNHPKILIADEPTGNLDSKAGDEIIDLLKSLNEQGYTIIMVTHNKEQALRANRVVKIKDGCIEEIYDTKKEI